MLTELPSSIALSAAVILSSVHCFRLEGLELGRHKVAGAECERFRTDNDFLFRGMSRR